MISVAMATYNGEEYIEKQIQSILSQSKKIDELIICDDYSTDRTVEIIEKMKNNKIFLSVNKTNIGYVRNFEKAISKTSGDYIFLADQDDIWEVNKVEEMIRIIQVGGYDLVCSNFELIDQDESVIKDKGNFVISKYMDKHTASEVSKISFNRLLLGNVLQGCTYCLTDRVKQVYLKVANKEVYHDWQLMLIGSYIGGVAFYNKKLIKYRIHDNNSVGFETKNSKIEIDLKIPKKVPTMIQFFRDFDRVISLDLITKIKVGAVFYFRVAYFIAKLHITL